ncbi:MAG TPA: condensation domain-containing protein, partial [Candidatus Deferrimicrobium sp.]|nr:condensation domain-containing protein [Candidatus Deferrimicrobium sp.]
IEKLEEASRKLIKRHDSLRTSFHVINDEPVQRIHDNVAFEIEQPGGRNPGAWLREQTKEGKIKSFIRPFDLSKAPLMHVGLFNIGEGGNLLLVDLHHIITDGTSQEVLKQDFMSLYKEEKLPSLRIQYKDFAVWQNTDKKKDKSKQQEVYWLKEFEGEIPVSNILTDYPRPVMKSFEGNRVDCEISAGETRALNALALQGGATLFMVLAAVLNILLAKLSGREDIVIGVPVAGRRHADLEKIIGMFVNTLALRNYPAGEKSLEEFLKELKERTLEAFENQEYPFEDLVEKVVFDRNMARNPLFDVMFVVQNIKKLPAAGFEMGDVENKTGDKPVPVPASREYHNIHPVSKFDLEITASEKEHGVKISFGYCTKLFKEETVKRFMIYFHQIVTRVLEEPGIKIGKIELITGEEKNRILYDFNNTTAQYPKSKTIHELFSEQVLKTPDRIAVVFSSIQITYRELDEISNGLAWLLMEKGVSPGTIVGIMSERSVEMITGIISILKSGGAYLPIDPSYPRQRIGYMLEDSNAKVLIINKSETNPNDQNLNNQNKNLYPGDIFVLNFEHLNLNSLRRCPRRVFHHSSFSIHHSSRLAYIIYTSGSTGKPKGVMVEHRSLVNLCCWHNVFYAVTSWDRAAKYAGFGFDASVWEIFPYLVAGASLYILPEKIISDIRALNGYYEQNHITISFLPTQVCEQFIALNNTSLRLLLTGGDKLRNYIEKNYRLYNNYGPTENTVVTTSYWVTGETGNIPIGKPIANNQVYILDRNNYLQPVGVPGELCTGGDGVARGYLNNPELTAEKFQNFHDSSFIIHHSILY